MKIKEKTYGDVQVISLEGNLIGEPEVSQVQQAVSNLLEDDLKKKIVVDLAKVKCVNSSGLGILIAFSASVKNGGGDLCLARMNDHVQSLFMVTHLVRIFRMYESLERAVSSFN